MKRFAVLGNPVSHSQSPVLFNKAFTESGIDAHYSRLLMDDLTEFPEMLNLLKPNGLNVTTPFKNDVIQYLNETDESIDKINAVNTIIINEKTVGCNTDCMGVYSTLKDEIVSPDTKILIIGSGNAASAAIYGLYGKAEIYLFNRTKSKLDKFKDCYPSINIINEIKTCNINFDIVVSAVPNSAVLGYLFHLKYKKVFLSDYRDKTIVNALKNNGISVISGENWLLNQAIPAMSLFCEEINCNSIHLCNQSPTLTNIVLIGFMGVGKTTIGKMIAKTTSMKFIDTDQAIEISANMAIDEIFNYYGEAQFREYEHKLLIDMLDNKLSNSVISCGGGILKNPDTMELLKKLGYVVWLFEKPDVFMKRAYYGNRPIAKKLSPEQLLKLYYERENSYFKASDLIVWAKSSPRDTFKLISEDLLKWNKLSARM